MGARSIMDVLDKLTFNWMYIYISVYINEYGLLLLKNINVIMVSCGGQFL